jgi:hypothetical protein
MPLSQVVDTDVDMVVAALGAPLAPGRHTAVFTFTGIHNDAMAGFYRSQ